MHALVRFAHVAAGGAKGLVTKVPRTRRYRLLPDGYRVCVVFLRLFERI